MKRGEIYFFDLEKFSRLEISTNFLLNSPKKILRLDINHDWTIFLVIHKPLFKYYLL